jgi:hypothetical protein
MRWHPMPLDGAAEDDFIDGMHTLAANGDAEAQTGIGRADVPGEPLDGQARLRQRRRRDAGRAAAGPVDHHDRDWACST